MPNTIEIKAINKLVKEKFFIPSYQRGYRWDEKQVTDLLNDILEFIDKPDKEADEFYCLQPIVVQRNTEGVYEVVDGQQRLTTIQIIQKYLGKATYSIDYANRKGSKEYLDDICNQYNQEISAKNIDFFFMKKAYEVTKEWFEAKVIERDEPTLGDEFNLSLGKNCKVIWYELGAEKNVESVFTRLNIGKIPLTNAELIKALFLQSKLLSKNTDIVKLRQLEIAGEWDAIENDLQQDQMWYFINPQRADIPTRIEYIFEAISGQRARDDAYSTFRYFQKYLETNGLIETWKEIKTYYQVIKEWFEDRKLYHLIGYLTSKEVGHSLQTLIGEYRKNQYSKHEFEDKIKTYIRASLEDIDIDALQYDDVKEVKRVLLLFNVITSINTGNVYARFPFDEYQKNVWTLEHIHAQHSQGLDSQEKWEIWIQEHLKSFRSFGDEKYMKLASWLEQVKPESLKRESFDALFHKVLSVVEEDYGNSGMHSISNLALLNKTINSSLNNSLFDVKRMRIVELDKKGAFIPLCTRNVFLKYYSKDVSHIHYWTDADRTDYVDSIKETIYEFLGVETTKEELPDGDEHDILLLGFDE